MPNFCYGRITPTAGSWHTIITATGDVKLNFIQVINHSISDICNLVLALRQTGDEITPPPAGVAVAPTGGVGTAKYEYAVTAVMTDGGETSPGTVVTINNGVSTLSNDNYHTVTWNAVTGAVSYRIYARKDDDTVTSISQAASATRSVRNKGAWTLSNKWPWVNLTGLRTLLAYEKLPPSTAFQLDSLIKLAAGWELRYFVTGDVSVSAMGEI